MQEPIKDDESREISFGPDPLSAALRGAMRTLVERLIREELVAALGAGPYERTPERRGYKHSPRERTITTELGPVTLTVPRGGCSRRPPGGPRSGRASCCRATRAARGRWMRRWRGCTCRGRTRGG